MIAKSLGKSSVFSACAGNLCGIVYYNRAGEIFPRLHALYTAAYFPCSVRPMQRLYFPFRAPHATAYFPCSVPHAAAYFSGSMRRPMRRHTSAVRVCAYIIPQYCPAMAILRDYNPNTQPKYQKRQSTLRAYVLAFIQHSSGYIIRQNQSLNLTLRYAFISSTHRSKPSFELSRHKS